VGREFGEGECGSDISCYFVGWGDRPVGLEASFFPTVYG
jgi:hypothetical protein